MQANGNFRVLLNGSLHQLAQKRLARIFARPGRRLQDDRAVAFRRRLHDGVDLLHVIDVSGFAGEP